MAAVAARATCIVPRFLSAAAWDELATLPIRILSTNASGLDWPWMRLDHFTDLARLRGRYAADDFDEEEHFAIEFCDPRQLGGFVRRHDERTVYALFERLPGLSFVAPVPSTALQG